jgi:hypothetical protein
MDEMTDGKDSKGSNYEKQMAESLEYAKWRDAFQRKNFDYQERWHGWQSPIGLGGVILACCIGIYFVSLAWTNLR